ncbi:MAG: glycosyltransferase [Oscillospiraceae bacterium]|nr:glycosyltransferase [Oscillospiraceae bacterium]
MRVLQINSVCGIRSTGRICTEIAKELEDQGAEVKIAYGRLDQVPPDMEKYAVRIGNDRDLKCHGLATRLLDAHGFWSRRATKQFLKWADSYDPDLLWLHNIHGYYINVEMLFRWIKSRPKMQVKWTLHDCWAFTGHCSHFDYVGCQKWKKGCHHCSQKKTYPTSLGLDNSRKNYLRKKAAFTGVKNLTIITPSQWLADLVKQSFLGVYPVEVRKNHIDLDVFKPTFGQFREKHGLENTKLILGVASAWSERKGLYDFYKLSEHLTTDAKVVLVGLDEDQMKDLPVQILGISRTNNAQELAEIYTTADVFFNPTYEDTYPTVNLEAQACETKVVAYDTGGCAETLYREDAKLIAQGDWKTCLEIVNNLKLSK